MGFSQEELRKLWEQQRQKQEAHDQAQTQAGLNMSVCVCASLCVQLWFVVWNAATREVLDFVEVGNGRNPLGLFTRTADTGGERCAFARERAKVLYSRVTL